MEMSFENEGYVFIPSAIGDDQIALCLRTINASIGSQGLPPQDMARMRQTSFCPDILKHPHLIAVANTFSMRYRNLLPDVPWTISEIQVALRFPGDQALRPHLDGWSEPRATNFMAVAGVYLSNITAEDAPIKIWPRSHQVVKESEDFDQTWIVGEPKDIVAKAGDAIVFDRKLIHGVAPHHGATIRYALYFRLMTS